MSKTLPRLCYMKKLVTIDVFMMMYCYYKCDIHAYKRTESLIMSSKYVCDDN